MRKFKHFEGAFGQFVAGAAHGVELEFDRSDAVAKLGLFFRERVLVEFIVQTHVEQLRLLVHEQRVLAGEFEVLSG